jgi:hypothetical protein
MDHRIEVNAEALTESGLAAGRVLDTAAAVRTTAASPCAGSESDLAAGAVGAAMLDRAAALDAAAAAVGPAVAATTAVGASTLTEQDAANAAAIEAIAPTEIGRSAS